MTTMEPCKKCLGSRAKGIFPCFGVQFILAMLSAFVDTLCEGPNFKMMRTSDPYTENYYASWFVASAA